MMTEVSNVLPDAVSIEQFHRDGVIHLPSALCRQTLDLALEAYEWSLAHPGPGAANLPSAAGGIFFQDLANPAALKSYQHLLLDTEIGAIVASLFGGKPVWFMYEQVFKKSGGSTRRTPWHQDSSYLPVSGAKLVVLWVSFDPVKKEQALEFVRGSHQGTLYDGSRFDPKDDTAPLYGDGSLPRLPDIEADRDNWPIVSWATDPGDLLVFHPAVLHGGAPTTSDTIRRTLSLRFFGADTRVAWRPGQVETTGENTAGPLDPGEHPLTRMRKKQDGAPFRDAGFLQIC